MLHGLDFTLMVITATCGQIAVGPNVQVSKARASQVHFDVVVATSPSNAMDLLASSGKTGKEYRSELALYRSSDGGLHWELVYESPKPLAGFDDQWSGADLAYGPDGSMYYAAGHVVEPKGQPATNGNHVEVIRSRDKGNTWNAIKLAGDSPGCPFISVDCTNEKFRGRVYCYGGSGQSLVMSTSTDAGRRFSPWRPFGSFSVKEDSRDLRPVPGPSAILSDGTLVIPYCLRGPEAKDKPIAFEICVGRYTTEASFSKPWVITRDKAPAGRLSSWAPSSVPMVAADPGSKAFKDHLYLAWSQRSGNSQRIMLAVSKDKGLSWSRPAVISDEPSGKNCDARIPAVAVNQNGVVAVSWYEFRPGTDGRPVMNIRLRASLDGGAGWLPSVCITDVPSRMAFKVLTTFEIPDDDFVGDRAGLAADAAGDFHPLWVDKRTGVIQVFTARVSVHSVFGGE